MAEQPASTSVPASAWDRYAGDVYLAQNPGWHVEDSQWKADRVIDALGDWRPRTICDVGCGAGEVLRQLHDRLRPERLVGYEVAEAAFELSRHRATDRLEFKLEDAAASPEHFDVMLLLDVIEHVEDPIGFLRSLRFKSDRTVLHIPLDLSVQSVLRPERLLHSRRTVGHLHYFTQETAVATVEDAGYRVVWTRHTGANPDLPAKSRKAAVAALPRRILPPGIAARTLGGFSLLVFAENGRNGEHAARPSPG
jgi:SAM-dependent methyltransferase